MRTSNPKKTIIYIFKKNPSFERVLLIWCHSYMSFFPWKELASKFYPSPNSIIRSKRSVSKEEWLLSLNYFPCLSLNKWNLTFKAMERSTVATLAAETQESQKNTKEWRPTKYGNLIAFHYQKATIHIESHVYNGKWKRTKLKISKQSIPIEINPQSSSNCITRSSTIHMQSHITKTIPSSNSSINLTKATEIQ